MSIDLAPPRTSTEHRPEPRRDEEAPTLGEAVTDLRDAVLRARSEDLHGDLVLCDQLESLALQLWVVVLEHCELPAWNGLAAPSNRWVVLERAVARLSTRVVECGLAGLPVAPAVAAAASACRRSLERAARSIS